MKKLMAGLVALGVSAPLVLAAAQAIEIKRIKGAAASPILAGVVVPAGASVFYLSGQVPLVADKTKPTESIEAYGDTKTQAISVFTKIKGLLADQGLTLSDVVKLTVFLVGDPKNGGKLDFKGFSEAYAQFFGTTAQPNIVARSTVQVAALANPGFLVEVEATQPRSDVEAWLGPRFRSRGLHGLRGLLTVLVLSRSSLAEAPAKDAGPQVSNAARALHEQLLTLDTHLDTPANFSLLGWNIQDNHERTRDGSQVDLPRLVRGGLDGGFWAIYTPQGPRTPTGDRAARDFALARALSIREMVAANAKSFEIALRADDAAAIAARHKRVVFLSIENSYPLEADLSLLETFYKLGVRLAGLAHFANNDLADSSTDPHGPEWHGLSDKGRALVGEANRLGIVLDGSHSSDQVLDQLIALSKTPVILSHSGVKAVFDHPRNIDDQRLRALAQSGGVIQINFMSEYLIATPKVPEREAALSSLWQGARKPGLTLSEREALIARKHEIDRRWPVPRATFADAFAHLLHALRVAGIDHVGIGADLDGGGGVIGFEDARDYPKITAQLLAEGYSREDIQKIWSGNVLRVLRAAEAQARLSSAAPLASSVVNRAPMSPGIATGALLGHRGTRRCASWRAVAAPDYASR